MSAHIRIRRERAAWTNRLRTFKIMVNGIERAAIKNGATIDVEIEPGQFSIQARISWCSSPVMTATVQDAETASFVVGNGDPSAIIGDTTRYLTLARDHAAPAKG